MTRLTMEEINKQLLRRRQAGIVYDLTRILCLLETMGNPQDRIPCIHIAGTNGKGSTSAFTVAALKAKGLNVGAFNSPVFGDVYEHVSIDGIPLDRDLFLDHAEELEALVQQTEEQLGQWISEFEWLVGLSYFIWDRVTPVDVVVLEAGMGGRLDATNVVKKPLVTAVTNVGLDHQAYLGETEAEIAWEKAGIMRCDVPFYTAAKGVALEVLIMEADRLNVPLRPGNAEGEAFDLTMAGAHQQVNANLAFQLVQEAGNAFGFTFTKPDFERAVRPVQVPGRFETVRESPRIILDTGHNMEAVEAVITELKATGIRPHIMFAAMKDKPVQKMLQHLETQASGITLTTFDHPRAIPLLELPAGYEVSENMSVWLKQWENRVKGDATLLITGSHQFIADVWKMIAK